MDKFKIRDVYKKALAGVTSLIVMFTSLGAALADSNTNEDESSFRLVKQEMKVEGSDLNISSYVRKLESSYNYLKQYDKGLAKYTEIDSLQADLEILYYISNRSYMSTETNNLLVSEGIVFGEDYVKENFNRAFDLMNAINSYNEATIRADYLNGTMDINHLIDPSVLCFDEHDREIVRSMFENYFNAYSNGDYMPVLKEITTLNAAEQDNNAHSLMTGAMWSSQITVGRETIEMIHDYMLREYGIKEVLKYYKEEELQYDAQENVARGEWVLRDDVLIDQNCPTRLENDILHVGSLEFFCFNTVNNNIYKIFNYREAIEAGEEEKTSEVSETNTEFVDSKREYQGEVTFSSVTADAFIYITSKINYDHLAADLECLSYLTNREYLSKEEEQELIDCGIVYETDFTTEEGLQNFMQAYSLINIILDYNQSTIRDDYRDNTMDINHLIDPSVICMDANDREIVHNMHVKYFEAYKNGRFENEEFYDVKEQLTDENTSASIGATWDARNIVGPCVMQLLRDDMQDKYMTDPVLKAKLAQYFQAALLNKSQWILIDGIEPDINSEDELEREVACFKALWPYVYDNSCVDLMATFQVDCTNTK